MLKQWGKGFDNVVLLFVNRLGHSDPRLFFHLSQIFLLFSYQVIWKSIKLVFEVWCLILGSASHQLYVFWVSHRTSNIVFFYLVRYKHLLKNAKYILRCVHLSVCMVCVCVKYWQKWFWFIFWVTEFYRIKFI